MNMQLQLVFALCFAAWACALASNCTSHVDTSGCRANSDIANVAFPPDTPVNQQVKMCGDLCCSMPECDAWAVREKYNAGWAHNCSVDGGKDCCLLKKVGWSMGSSLPGCTSGGRSAAPPGPPIPPPPPPTPPLPRGGGMCSDAWDCSLGGECTGGRCVCDIEYTGPQCGVLSLQRAKLNNGMQVNTTHTWGGHALKDPKSGKYVGYFSYMAGQCDLNRWGSNSMIISAVADAPDGPYNQELTPVVGPWSHNAMISKHPNGSYFLFHIGTGALKGKFSPCTSNVDPLYPFPAGQPEPALATTHIADSLRGPWRAAPTVKAVNNPCPFFFANGTTLLFDRTSVSVAPSVDGPWTAPSRPTVVGNGTMSPEDPGVYRDHRGNFHMLFNANSGHKHCPANVPCGGHAWSYDGLAWSQPRIPAFGTIVHYEDNSTVTYNYCERPQIIQDDGGVPITFFAGHGYSGIHTLAINFCKAGDIDCVTTVQ